MRHEVIRDLGAWRRLHTEWNDLLRDSHADSIFMSFEWLDSWLDLYDSPPPLFIVCVRDDDGRLVGAAPFYVVPYRLFHVLPYSVLRIIGDCNTGAEYQNWLARHSIEGDVYAEIVKALRTERRDWDLIWMPRLDSWSKSHEPMVAAMRSGGLTVNRRDTDFGAFPLPADMDAYLSQMSANRRQQVRRTTKKILAGENVTVRRVSSEEELPPILDALFDLHTKRWKSIGEDGVFERNPLEKEFYSKFVPKAFRNGWVALYTLFDNDEPKAVQFGYVYNGVFLQLQEGFDPDYASHVGNALRLLVIEDCIRNGLAEYDFLGGMSEHKRRWLALERTGCDLLAARPSIKTSPIMKAGVWPTGAYLRPQAA